MMRRNARPRGTRRVWGRARVKQERVGEVGERERGGKASEEEGWIGNGELVREEGELLVEEGAEEDGLDVGEVGEDWSGHMKVEVTGGDEQR